MSAPVVAPILNILGEQVALGPMRRDLVPLYQRWMNDFEVTRTLAFGWRPQTAEGELAWYEATSGAADERTFTVYERATLRPIGNSGLMHIDPLHRNAEFGIVLGEKDCWGKGYGAEVAALILDYGFTALNLHMIWLQAYADNVRGLRAYARAGFKPAGRLRGGRWIGGKPSDVVLMDCLASEFESPVLRRLLPHEIPGQP